MVAQLLIFIWSHRNFTRILNCKASLKRIWIRGCTKQYQLGCKQKKQPALSPWEWGTLTTSDWFLLEVFYSNIFLFIRRSSYNEMSGDDETDGSRPKVKISETSQSSTGSVGMGSTSSLDPATYVNKISNVTTQVVGRMGNVFGKGLGGLGGKLGGPSSWF